MLRRFSVTLAQLTAVDNSEKLQNKTRGTIIFFSSFKKVYNKKVYKSITKNIYNNLISTI